MRDNQQHHYFKTDEINLLKRITHDIRAVIECNKEGEAPHQRLKEWACWLEILHNRHSKGEKNGVNGNLRQVS